jgi:hypothetical protein
MGPPSFIKETGLMLAATALEDIEESMFGGRPDA